MGRTDGMKWVLLWGASVTLVVVSVGLGVLFLIRLERPEPEPEPEPEPVVAECPPPPAPEPIPFDDHAYISWPATPQESMHGVYRGEGPMSALILVVTANSVRQIVDDGATFEQKHLVGSFTLYHNWLGAQVIRRYALTDEGLNHEVIYHPGGSLSYNMRRIE